MVFTAPLVSLSSCPEAACLCFDTSIHSMVIYGHKQQLLFDSKLFISNPFGVLLCLLSKTSISIYDNYLGLVVAFFKGKKKLKANDDEVVRKGNCFAL